MKQLIFLAAIAIVAISCNPDEVRPFIPGTYVNTAGSEFSIADDTLIIKASENNNFQIDRRTGFNLVSDGKVGKREYETENWNAVYDEATKTLAETKKGKLITFYPDSVKLMVGKRTYKKLNYQH